MASQQDTYPLLGIGLNHVQAIRDAMIHTIGGGALLSVELKEVAKWLREQGLKQDVTPGAADDAVSLISKMTVQYRCQQLGEDFFPCEAISSSQISPGAKFIGIARSGAGWSRGAAFCIGAAFVQILGALDQFELDVAKALFYHRPFGILGPDAEYEDITVDLNVVSEQPTKKDVYRKPPLWTWLKPRAERAHERREIFAKVFGIQTLDEKQGWRDKRNKIAHGRPIEIKLKEYLDADVFVLQAMLHLAKQCQERQHLII